MGLIDVNNVTKKFNDEVLFSSISFTLNKESKLALIGKNGAGKTTLVKMILGIEDYQEGSINILKHVHIGYLSQMIIHDLNNTLYEEMLLSFSEVIELSNRIKDLSIKLEEDPSNQKLIEEYGLLQTKFEALDGYDYQYKIDMILSKFGFNKEDYNRKISSFSGGEKNKVAFSRLLLDHPEVLILDEPTNHLDMDTIKWLEEYLRCYEGALIVISHDRYFIDNVCNCVFEISQNKGEYYQGNYTYYLEEKVIRYEQRLKQYNLQEKEIKHLKDLILRFKPKPTKTSFAKDREKKLAKILKDKINKPTIENNKLHITFKDESDISYKQLLLKDLVVGYDKGLNEPFSIEIKNGNKIAIIGDNGIGKTTLLKTIYEKLKPISGTITKYRELNFGYIDQNVIEISSSLSLFDYIRSLYPYMDNYQIRSHLGSFLFSDEDVFKSVDSLSGGEKVRLVFATLLLSNYNVLLLDEPTNHLDIETRKILESALNEFKGTIIFVSHDRYFISEVADTIIHITKSNTNVFKGSFEEYQLLLDSIEDIKNNKIKIEEEKNDKEKSVKVKTHKVNKDKLEEKIKKLEEEIELNKSFFEEEEYYTDQNKIKELEDYIDDLYASLHELEKQYLEILENE